MKNKVILQLGLFIVAFFTFFTSCDKEEVLVGSGEKEPVIPEDTIYPGDFSLQAVSVSPTSIYLNWGFSNQAVSYEIALNDSIVAYDVQKPEYFDDFYYLLSGLKSDTDYKVTVKALTETRKKNAQTIITRTSKDLLSSIYPLPLEDYNHSAFSHYLETSDGGALLSADVFSYGRYYQAVMKLDKNGNKEWVNHSDRKECEQLLECKDGGFLIVSYYEIFKLSNRGQRLWTLKPEYPDELRKNTWHGVIENAGGEFILVGMSLRNWGNLTKSVEYFMTKLSSHGQVVWNKFAGKSLDNRMYKIVDKENGNYLVMGTAESTGATFEKLDYRIFSLSVLEIDDDGNVIWEKWDDNNDREAIPQNIQKTPDGHFILTMTQSVLDYFSRSGFAPRFIKMAGDGTVVWDKMHLELDGGGVSPGIRALKVNPDNSYSVLTVDDRGTGLGTLSPSGEVVKHIPLYGYPSGIYIADLSGNRCLYFAQPGYFLVINWDGYRN